MKTKKARENWGQMVKRVGKILCWVLFVASASAVANGAGKLELRFIDATTEQPLTVRMKLFRSSGKPAPIRRGIPTVGGTVIDGSVDIHMPADTYSFIVSRGPEYHEVRGTFSISDNSDEVEIIRVPRILSMWSEGWISGDIATAIPENDIELRCSAENLQIVGVASDKPDPSRQTSNSAGKFENKIPVGARTDIVRGTGSGFDLMAIGGSQELRDSLRSLLVDGTPSCRFITEIERASSVDDCRLIILNPMAYDLPLWLASGNIDGIAVLGEFLQVDHKKLDWPGSTKPNKLEMTGNHALGLWSVHIYEQLLEAGFNIPPIATSGSGFQQNPLGYSRTYVYSHQLSASPNLTPEEFQKPSDTGIAEHSNSSLSYVQSWWDGLWHGRSVVTSGPLLRPMLEGEAPGHTFQASAGQVLKLTLSLQLAIRDPVDYLEVIQNGKVTYKARLDEFARQGGRIPPLEFETSSWVMVRVMTKYEDSYRAAMSAPWFIHFDGQTRRSRKAVQFFQDLLVQREQQLARLPREEIAQHAPDVRAARAFWERQADLANAP